MAGMDRGRAWAWGRADDASERRSANGACRKVVVVPGIMGTELEINRKVVWGHTRNAFGGMSSLVLPPFGPSRSVRPTRVIDRMWVGPLHRSIYRDLFEALRGLGYADPEILRFPYDWRRDNRVSAGALKDFLEEERYRLRPGERFTILAHSMGGLVARYCVQKLGGDRLVDRIVTMGTPHRGSLDALEALLVGPKLHPADVFRGARLRAVRSFPSVYQLLPRALPTAERWVRDDARPPGAVDLFSRMPWPPDIPGPLIGNASGFHQELETAPLNVDIFSIYGIQQRTMARAVFPSRGGDRWRRVDFGRARRGDDRVLDASARFDPDRSRTSGQHHARIWKDAHAWAALRDLLCGPPPISGPPPAPPGPPPSGTEPPARLILDVTVPFAEPGGSFQVAVGRVDVEGSLVTNGLLRIALRDENGEVRQESVFVPREPSLVVREFRVPTDRGVYGVEVSDADGPDLDPVEDYLLVEDPREMEE